MESSPSKENLIIVLNYFFDLRLFNYSFFARLERATRLTRVEIDDIGENHSISESSQTSCIFPFSYLCFGLLFLYRKGQRNCLIETTAAWLIPVASKYGPLE